VRANLKKNDNKKYFQCFFPGKKAHLSDTIEWGKPVVIEKITLLICLLRIRQGPGLLFLWLSIAAREW
jgi:hypothetical protein